MANYLLFDLNSVGRAAHGSTKLSVGDEETQAIFLTLKTVQRFLKKYPDHKPIALNDGRAQWRFDLFPLYKGNRDDSPEKIAEANAYRAQKATIIKALISLGVTVITDPNAEADDLAGHFSRKLGKVGNSVKLITGDGDWKQLVSKYVTWEDHRDGRFCDSKNFQEITGFHTTNQFLEAKCLTGDTSDNIPGVGGIGDKGVEILFAHYATATNFLKELDEGAPRSRVPRIFANFADNVAPKDSKKYGKMLGARDAFKRNMALMNLNSGYQPNKSTLQVRGGPVLFSKTTFKELCEDLLFRSILVQLDRWILPFENLTRGKTL